MTSTKRARRIIAMAVLWMLLLPCGARAIQETLSVPESVQALGIAPFQGKEITTARQVAIANALSVAMSQVALHLLPLETISAHFGRIGDLLLAKPETFVRDFRVVGEHAGGGAYRILVLAHIDWDKVSLELDRAGIAPPAAAAAPSASAAPPAAAPESGEPTLAAPAMPATSAAAPSEAGAPAQLTLQVDGTDQLGFFVQFRNALRELSGVRAMLTREMRANQSTLQVEYGGSPRALAEALQRKSFSGFRLEIRELGEDSLLLGLVPN